MTRVTVLVRAGCTACERMEAVVRDVCAESATAWAAIDVDAPDADPELRGEYGDIVPVTLVDGVEHAASRVDPDALRAALTR